MANIVIIGASDRSVIWRYGIIPAEEYPQFVKDYAAILAPHFERAIVTPDDGTYADIAMALAEERAKLHPSVPLLKPIGFAPLRDTLYGVKHLEHNFPRYEIVNGGTWYDVNAELTAKALTVLCVGYAPGVMIELGYIKYHQKYGSRMIDANRKDIRILIDRRTISGPLHSEVAEGLENVQYFGSFEELAEILRAKWPQ